MKQYPSIQKETVNSVDIFAFDKLDGSNIRAEFSSKKGFHKFGSRNQLIDENSFTILKHSISLIKEKYTERFIAIRKQLEVPSLIGFFEFFGPHSFAGFHTEEDLKTFDVVLFDIDAYKKGLLPPREFINLTKNVPTATLLYTGKANESFIKSVKDSTLDGMTFEGVVCKGSPTKNGYPPLMFKIKSNKWIDRLKKEKAEQFEILL